jgi:hypothetical protein
MFSLNAFAARLDEFVSALGGARDNATVKKSE